jgi:hypothetical protein
MGKGAKGSIPGFPACGQPAASMSDFLRSGLGPGGPGSSAGPAGAAAAVPAAATDRLRRAGSPAAANLPSHWLWPWFKSEHAVQATQTRMSGRPATAVAGAARRPAGPACQWLPGPEPGASESLTG